MSESNYQWLQGAVSGAGVVVTASRRLARELRERYDLQQAVSKEAWLTPAIWPWQDWLSRQLAAADNASDVPTVLDAASCLLLWERCLEGRTPDGLPGFGVLVRQASQSWLRLEEWNVALLELLKAARSPDERLFSAAASAYANKLAQGNWIDVGGKAGVVAQLLNSRRIAAPAKIMLAGFDRISPAVQGVIDALGTAGSVVDYAPVESCEAQAVTVSFERGDAELRAAGAWARQLLDENPTQRIAIVVPALEADAANSARLIREGLVPGWQYGGGAFAAAANVSYGRKLADYPAIAIALLLLRWSHRGLKSREISLLLRSRCIASDVIAGRCRLELDLRRYPDREWLPDEFLQVFGRADASQDVAAFIGCVSALSELQAQRSRRLGPAEWAIKLHELLQKLAWPGPSTLESDEFQLVNRWRELLNEFARLAAVASDLSLSEAVHRLSTLAADTLYQPESGSGLVQVLGTLEAAGLEFDHLWVSGMDSTQWPSQATPARFVSHALQRQHGMPDATPADALMFAQQMLRRLTTSAPACVLSWARARDDLELNASSLLDGLSAMETAAIADPGWYANSLLQSCEIGVVDADAVPTVATDERIRGGAYTVQRQLTEPFGAFVHGRLNVKHLERIEVGLSPGMRGNIIHSALQTLLAGRPTQDEVRSWEHADLVARIDRASDAALVPVRRYADTLLKCVLQLERKRLQQLLRSFIAVEKNREQYAVMDVERQLDYRRFGVWLSFRIDRIDALPDGRMLLIDYKTGAAKRFLNQRGELTDAQLVVYADALSAASDDAGNNAPDDVVGGLALMNIDSRDIEFSGAGDGGPWRKGTPEQWVETLHLWRAQVHQALQNLAAGDARLNMQLSIKDSRPLSILSRKEVLKRAGE